MSEKIKTLTRADIATKITDVFNVTRLEALDFVDEAFNEISEAIIEEGNLKITGFGTFIVRSKKERIGRNPKTLKEAVISSRKSITFRPSGILKKKVMGEREC